MGTRSRRRLVAFTALVVASLLASWTARAQASTTLQVEVVAPGVRVISSGSEKLVLYTGSSASLVVGVHAPVLVEKARQLVQELKSPAVRWAVMMDGPGVLAYGDGGWGNQGAVTLAQELLHSRISRHLRSLAYSGGAERAESAPAAGFSQVVQLYMGPEEIHLVHPQAGYTDADVIVHWEQEGVVYMGNTFTNDGYPEIDYARGGSLSGMIATLDFFLSNFAGTPGKVEPIIPGRGSVATFADLRAYRDMLVSVRDRLLALLAQGKTAEEAVAAKPTADLDARWGQGPVRGDQFVAAIYEAMARARRGSTQSAPGAAPPAASGHNH